MTPGRKASFPAALPNGQGWENGIGLDANFSDSTFFPPCLRVR